MLSKTETRPKDSVEATERPTRTVGIIFASVFYYATGLYYIIFPLITQDFGAWHLYTIAVVSLATGYLLLRVHKWGLWLGLLLFPVQVVTPAFAVGFNVSSVLGNPEYILFLASLILLVFFASVTLLVLIDQRKSFEATISTTSDSQKK